MNTIKTYLKETLGFPFSQHNIEKNRIAKLPIYLNSLYSLKEFELQNKKGLIAYVRDLEKLTISQIEKHFEIIISKLNLPVVLVTEELESYYRKRLIEKKIGFIVPDRQIYIPEFMIDLKEYKMIRKNSKHQIIPAAQVILLNHILSNENLFNIQNKVFKDLASLFSFNAMMISRVAENLEELHLCETVGDKEKFIKFKMNRRELWEFCLENKIWISPIQKKYFLDEFNGNIHFLKSNISALSDYTFINPGIQMQFAIYKKQFSRMNKRKELKGLNDFEGKICLEVWKYDPKKIMHKGNKNLVDPLSLYLSLINEEDERIKIELKNLLEKVVW